jgi:uncharacterized coiled-coil protein SlyX
VAVVDTGTSPDDRARSVVADRLRTNVEFCLLDAIAYKENAEANAEFIRDRSKQYNNEQEKLNREKAELEEEKGELEVQMRTTISTPQTNRNARERMALISTRINVLKEQVQELSERIAELESNQIEAKQVLEEVTGKLTEAKYRAQRVADMKYSLDGLLARSDTASLLEVDMGQKNRDEEKEEMESRHRHELECLRLKLNQSLENTESAQLEKLEAEHRAESADLAAEEGKKRHVLLEKEVGRLKEKLEEKTREIAKLYELSNDQHYQWVSLVIISYLAIRGAPVLTLSCVLLG